MVDVRASNYSRFGATPRAKRGMLCFGVTRYMLSGLDVVRAVTEAHHQIEYLVVCYDEQNRKVRLSLRQADILAALASDEKLLREGGGVPDVQRGPIK